MLRWVLGFGLSCVAGLALAPGCSSASGGGGGGPGGSTGGNDSGVGGGVGASGGTGGISTGGTSGDSGLNPDAACALFTKEAKQAPAAMLFAVDGSASMAQSSKWGTAQLATVNAIDKDSFDNTSLGLVRFPASQVPSPQCLCDTGICILYPTVACGVSFLPQVALADSGTQKANQGGVRKQIYDYLVNNGPSTDPFDASPIYDAMLAGYAALEAYNIDKRVLVLITDGGFSCTSLSNPKRAGYTDGACEDWEYPDTVNALIKQKRDDPNKPIFTFVIGVPGSNSTGQTDANGYATAPYSMLLALSSYAYSGSPATTPSGCEQNFTKTGPAPGLPCHFDLSKGTFDPNTLAAAIDSIRGAALGCIYDLPEPPPGQTINPDKVNVETTLDGTKATVPKRSDPNDTCETEPCWDYNDKGQVELIGKACSDVSQATDAKVDVYVGCDTIIK